MKKIKMNDLTLALSGYNLFTITDLSGVIQSLVQVLVHPIH